MKIISIKTMLIGIAACACAAQAQVELKGIGWDGAAVNNLASSSVINNPAQGELTVRLGLGGYNNLEGGFGFSYMETADGATTAQQDAASLLSFSLRYLLALHEWDKFTGFLVVGGHFQDDFIPGEVGGNHSTANSFSLMAGYQPEIQLMQHFSVSTRFGLQYTITPITVVGLVGSPVSIVDGVDFHILF